MSHPHSPNLGRARRLLAWALLTVGAAPAGAGTLGEQLSFGGNLSFTTDYIYHGVSESNDRGALQGDLHLATTERQLRRGVGLDPRQPARPRRQL